MTIFMNLVTVRMWDLYQCIKFEIDSFRANTISFVSYMAHYCFTMCTTLLLLFTSVKQLTDYWFRKSHLQANVCTWKNSNAPLAQVFVCCNMTRPKSSIVENLKKKSFSQFLTLGKSDKHCKRDNLECQKISLKVFWTVPFKTNLVIII